MWLLQDFELIEPILPELAGMLPFWEIVASLVGALAPEPVTFPLAFAALIHTVDTSTAEAIADRLRLSNAEKSRITWLVENQRALLNAPTMRMSKLKPILVHPGILELIALHRAHAGYGDKSDVEFCERILRETPREELDPPPAVTGNDLKALGLKPGPDFKRLLDAVREAQLDGLVRTRDEGLALVRSLLPAPG
jgi:poly(A) polymerase